MRLMIDIARQGEAGALVTMRQAAEREDLSVKYLEQLGGALVKAGRSQKRARRERRVSVGASG